jgi:hypothetical protein
MNATTLTGTETQIKCANIIRETMLEDIEKYSNITPANPENPNYHLYLAGMETLRQLRSEIENESAAIWFLARDGSWVRQEMQKRAKATHPNVVLAPGVKRRGWGGM